MNRNRLTDAEDRSVVAKWEGAVGQMEWEDGISRCKLLYVEWINNNVLRHSPERRKWQPTPVFFFISHSSILAWEIPWTKEPGGLQFIGSQKEQDTTWQLKGNYIQYPMISHNGKEYTYKYIYMYN